MASGKRIKVLVVDDSIVFRTAISRGLEADPAFEIVGSAFNTHDARDKIMQLNPDVITLDVEMPGMNGIEFLKILMPQRPMPVIVVSAVDGIVFEAMRAGAVDFIAKPASGGMGDFIKELADKIKIAAVASLRPSFRQAPARPASARNFNMLTSNVAGSWSEDIFVALGASTGGTEATSLLLKGLPENFPGMVIVQHMPPVFTRMYAERLDKESKLHVSEAKEGDIVRPGYAYVAPGDRQLRVVKQGARYIIRLGGTERVSGHCPSVDVLFESVAIAAPKKAIGVILTGMGADGAKGLLSMRKTGSFTVGQDQQSSVVYGMPMEAYKLGAVARQASIDMVASVLINQLKLMK